VGLVLRSRWDGGGGLEEGGGARPEDAGRRPRDGLLHQELVAGQAAVPRPALRVEDPERGPPVRRPVVVLRDADLRPLSHDLATQPDPAAPPELQAQAGTLVERGPERRGGVGRLEDEKERAGPPGERDQSSQLVGEVGGARAAPGRDHGDCRRDRCRPPRAHWPLRARRPQVQHQDVDRARLEQRAGHRERLGRVIRDQDREPLETDAAGHRLDRVERAREVHPRGEGTGILRSRERPHGEGGGATRAHSRERNRARARETTPHQQRVEFREPGRDRGTRGRDRSRARRGGERPEHLQPASRRSRAPPFAKAGKGAGGIGVILHRTLNDRTSVL